MAPLQLLPSITVPTHTYGTSRLLLPPHGAGVRLIAWHTPTNAWQVLLAFMNVLGLEVRVRGKREGEEEEVHEGKRKGWGINGRGRGNNGVHEGEVHKGKGKGWGINGMGRGNNGVHKGERRGNDGVYEGVEGRGKEKRECKEGKGGLWGLG